MQTNSIKHNIECVHTSLIENLQYLHKQNEQTSLQEKWLNERHKRKKYHNIKKNKYILVAYKERTIFDIKINIHIKEPQKDCTHTHKGIIAGKLKGHIPAQTPTGSLMQYVSIPLDALGTNSPICKVAIPQACSTTSASKTEREWA